MKINLKQKKQDEVEKELIIMFAKERNKTIEQQKEIERLKDLVKQLWNNNKSSNLNEEQKELLNSTIFGSDKE